MTSETRSQLRERLPPALRPTLLWVGIVLASIVPVVAWLALSSHMDALIVTLWLAAVVLPAGLLKHHPLSALALMILIALVPYQDSTWDTVVLRALILHIAVGYIAARRRPRVSIVAAVMVFAAEAFATYAPGPGWPHTISSMTETVLLFVVMMGLTSWIIGNSVRLRRKYAVVQREQAVNAERLRIARELHDMISHSIGVIAIQAGMGARVIDTQPDEARSALNTIEVTSRDTLAQLRRTLGSLRRTEAVPATFDPAPGLADLDRLVASTLDGGVRVDLSVRGDSRPIPADIDLSAYRIIQEALTNVVRHAGADTCRVDVEYRDEELHIDISDEGTGTASPGAGYGIAGMRERVDMLKGELSAGPRPEGGFAVSARLLLPRP